MKRKQDDGLSNSSAISKKLKAEGPGTSTTISQVDLTSLQHLLDFTSLDNTSEIYGRFDLIAHALLHDVHLVVRCGAVDTRYEILELEFYLQKAESHEDPFTHGSEEQKISGRWYFHRAPKRSEDSHRNGTSLTGYRGGSRKGLDLTLGGPAIPLDAPVSPDFSSSSTAPSATGSTTILPQPRLLRGGALLRSIRRVSDSKIISGPSLLVDQILLVSKASSIIDLVLDKWAGNTSAFLRPEDVDKSASPGPSLFLKLRGAPPPSFFPLPTKPEVYCSPRIGLDLSHPGTTTSPKHPRVVFLPRPYRYFVLPHLLTANGRTQTFLGVLRVCLKSGLVMGSAGLRAKLVRVTGLKESSVDRYLMEYQEGVNHGDLKDFVGPVGKGASGSPATYLRMMGTLERMQTESEEAK